jgi:hypothetical protein
MTARSNISLLLFLLLFKSFWELLKGFLRTKVNLSIKNTKEKRVFGLTFTARALDAFSICQLGLRVDFLTVKDRAMSFDARDA